LGLEWLITDLRSNFTTEEELVQILRTLECYDRAARARRSTSKEVPKPPPEDPEFVELRNLSDQIEIGGVGEVDAMLKRRIAEIDSEAEASQVMETWNKCVGEVVANPMYWQELQGELTDQDERRFIQESGISPSEYFEWRLKIITGLIGLPKEEEAGISDKHGRAVWGFLKGRF
jgi:hypothetical protein